MLQWLKSKLIDSKNSIGNDEDSRIIIIHNHVFKNAGSTIDWALRQNFGDSFVDHRDDKEMMRGKEYLGPYLNYNPLIKALSTHHLRPPLPILKNIKLFTIMMFRHPIERVTSVYNFERKQLHADTLGAKFARNHDIKDYVLWRMRLDVPPTIRNFHIYRSIPGQVNWKLEVNEFDLIKAKGYVNSLELLGFVSHFDESMVLFEETLRPFLPNINLSYQIQNVGQKRTETKEQRIERLEVELGKDVYKSLIDGNKKDIELYYYAFNNFQERLNNINSLESKLADFRNRCKRHIK